MGASIIFIKKMLFLSFIRYTFFETDYVDYIETTVNH